MYHQSLGASASRSRRGEKRHNRSTQRRSHERALAAVASSPHPPTSTPTPSTNHIAPHQELPRRSRRGRNHFHGGRAAGGAGSFRQGGREDSGAPQGGRHEEKVLGSEPGLVVQLNRAAGERLTIKATKVHRVLRMLLCFALLCIADMILRDVLLWSVSTFLLGRFERRAALFCFESLFFFCFIVGGETLRQERNLLSDDTLRCCVSVCAACGWAVFEVCG